MTRRELLAAALAAPIALGLAPRLSAARLGGTPLALVTADLEAHVAVLDLSAAGRVVARIPTLPGPRSIEAVLGTHAVVAHTGLGAVSLVDGLTRSVRRVVRGFGEPRYTAVRPAEPVAGAPLLAYITDSARGEVVTLDVSKGRIVHRTPVAGPARHISASPDGTSVWTALGTKAARVAVLDVGDPSRPHLLRTFTPPFLAHDVAFAPDGRHVWVSSGSEGALAVYEPDGRSPVRIVPAHEPPQHITFARGLVFVASGDSGTVRVHRRDGALVRTTRVPAGSFNVTTDVARIVTPSLSEGTLCVLDDRGRRVAVTRVARAAHDACLVVG